MDDLAHLGAAQGALLVLGLDLTADHALHVLDQLVDDAVALEGDALALGGLDDAAGRVDAEAHDGGVGGGGQEEVGLRGGAHLGQHDLHVHLVGAFGFLGQDGLDGLSEPWVSARRRMLMDFLFGLPKRSARSRPCGR